MDIQTYASDKESSIYKLKKSLDQLVRYDHRKIDKLHVTIEQMNRILSSYYELKVDLSKNFILKIEGTLVLRLLKFFEIEKFSPF